jgi:hypothetical protein
LLPDRVPQDQQHDHGQDGNAVQADPERKDGIGRPIDHHAEKRQNLVVQGVQKGRQQHTAGLEYRVAQDRPQANRVADHNKDNRGAVELDALEALYPGKLAEITESAILDYYNEDLAAEV